jgi:hypothetical protein
MPKTKISVTVEAGLAEEIDEYFRKLVKQAATSGNDIPKISNIYEDIIKKGWEAIKKKE